MRKAATLLALLPLAAAGLGGGLWLGLGGDAEATARPRGNFSTADAARFSEFRLYDLGPAHEGLPVTAVIRDDRLRLPGERVRENAVTFVYGDCEPVEDTGCAPPLQVQVWPACERNLAVYPNERILPRRTLRLRGVPAALFEDGHRLELYTGRETVVIFGNDTTQVLRAAAALRSVGGPAGGELPAPAAGALSGRVAC